MSCKKPSQPSWRQWLGGIIFFLAAGGVSAGALPAASPPAATGSEVAALLRTRCAGCHGASLPSAGLDLTTLADLMEGGVSGSPVVRGKPDQSLLMKVLEDGRMPKGGMRFSASELSVVTRWIRGGARVEPRRASGGHWAFTAPTRPIPPTLADARRVSTPIDRFLLANLQRRQLDFAPEASRPVLLRRVTFDLIGLPPTAGELDAFTRDRSPDAYEKVVDRLLADPRFGERWARFWLDTAGYAESEGVLQEDRVRPNAWRYRDYVIRSFNNDKPYDQFVREQLAADELLDYRRVEKFTPEIVDTLAATGFLRTAVDATRDDFNPHQYGEYQYRMLHDTQTIVTSTMLGLPMHCARCHDHKYEPLSQRDYYRLQGFFTPAVRPRGKLLPTSRRQIVAATASEQEEADRTNKQVDAALSELQKTQAELQRRIGLARFEQDPEKVAAEDRIPLRRALTVADSGRSMDQKALVKRYQGLLEPDAPTLENRLPELRSEQMRLEREKAAVERRRISLTTVRGFYDQDAQPPATTMLIRGDWLRPGPEIEPGVPGILAAAGPPFRLPPTRPDTTGRRTALAWWLTDAGHPLTARVIANRIWTHQFGVGLVATPDNFGRSGARPTHPALLDWLSVSLVSDWGWRLKPLHRMIVLSSAYRQSTVPSADALRLDPENRWLSRQRGRRLEAEAVRDAMLAAAGNLDPAMFGEPVGLETKPTGEVVAAGEEGRGRRSIYLLVRRTQPVALLNAFDAPVMETNCTRRASTATAGQALTLLNSGFIAAQAQSFAALLERGLTLREGSPPADPACLIRMAFTRALGRPPSPAEGRRFEKFLADQTAHYEGKPGSARRHALADLCQALLACNEFLYVD